MTKEIASAPSGIIQPFVFDNMPVRGMVLRINDISSHIPSLKDDESFLSKSLAEMLAACAVLNVDLKNEANITLQVHSESAVPLMVAQCDRNNNLRAFANLDDDCDLSKITYKDVIDEKALFALTVEQGKTQQHVYQSYVALNRTSVSSSIEQYFNDSVQLNTYFMVVTDKVDGKLACGAIFLQALPSEETKEDDWRRLAMILSTMTKEEALPGKITETDLLQRLFAEDQVRIYETKDLNFATPKSRERMAKALKSVGIKQCKELLEDGPIEMACEFTGTQETFEEEDLRNIFGTQWDEE